MNRSTFLVLAVLALVAIAFFASFPNSDLAVAGIFYSAPTGFAGRGTWGNFARTVFSTVPFLVLTAYVIAWGGQRMGRVWRFAPSGREVAFVLATMALGPGLLVNFALKDHTHRPRPVHVQPFGGPMEFRPFFKMDGACVKNCAFPSGEASASFWLVAPALLAPPPLRPLAVGAALAFGTATGLLRMAFGGHFLSDVVLAALLTLLLVGACWRVFFGWGAKKPHPSSTPSSA